jgi:DNA-3-methyladenine glycosylase II
MGMTIRIIADEAEIAEGVAWLGRLDPRFGAVAARAGLPATRRAPGGLPGLLRIVTDQMVSLQAGEAIWKRIEKALHPFDPPLILKKRHATLMRLGLSGNKARAFRAIAQAADAGAFDRLDERGDDEVLNALTAIAGIGPWTADIYLLACLGRADAWPAGDLALQAAAADLFGLPQRPDGKAMAAMAEAWRPWRSVAARLLWAHYRFLKGLKQA